LVIWFSEEAVAAWRAAPRTTPGGQARYSDVAIETSLILRAVFHQPLRQTEVLVGSLLGLMGLMGLDLPVPDHSTLSRRATTLAVAPQVRTTSGPVHLLVDSTRVKLSWPGEWLVEKHGTQRCRAWRKLHLGRRCENRHDRRLDPDQQGGRRCRQTRIPTECSTLDARNPSAPPNNQGRTAVLRSSPSMHQSRSVPDVYEQRLCGRQRTQGATHAVRKIVTWAGQAARLGFPIYPHMLRHATGYKLAKDGRDTRSIQHYLGHRNIQHTTRCTQLAPGRFKDFWMD
jgi:hypothetical protein